VPTTPEGRSACLSRPNSHGLLLGAAITVIAALVPGARGDAATASASLNVSASVANNCTISTAALAFGVYDPLVANASANLDATGTVTIACTKGATSTIALNLGSNASGTTRRMTDGSSNFLTYEMYQDSSHSTVWGSSGTALFTPPAAPSKTARNFTVYGRIPGSQDIPAGTYADTVTATVNF
jgi:spore coat protein U-like protein